MNKTIRVLIVEDEPVAADTLKELLCGDYRSRFSCAIARNLREGLVDLKKEVFDIVLLDLGLPDSTGIDTASTVRREFPRMPVIALTGLIDEEVALKALRMDIQDYLIKGQIAGGILDRSIRYAIERKRAIDALRESEEKFRVFFESAAVGTAQIDPATRRFVQVNDKFCRIMGYACRELLSLSLNEITHPDDRSGRDIFDELISGKFSEYSREQRCIRKDGRTVWVQIAVTLIRDIAGEYSRAMVIVQDITDRKRLEQEIRHMAHHDSLTGLPNRRLFRDVADVELAQAKRHGGKLAVFFIDLDRFKEINDTLGHEVGDALLRETASRLRAELRTSDTVARIGGDEFNILVPDIAHAEYASEVARKILDRIRKPFRIVSHELNVSTSIGISVYPEDSEEIETLLQYADMAMYYAKEHGRDRYQFYNPVINTRSIERTNFEKSLRRAVERGEFRLYFQPLVNIETRKIVSVEVLLRWQHPERGLLSPGLFFPAAEDIGFMPEIDEWVLKAAGGQIKTWLDQGLWPVCLTVNLSTGQFHNPRMAGWIARILEETGMPAECLDLEITETAAMRNIDTTIEQVGELSKIGVHVSIDHFGTGSSSLNLLKRLPIRKLKIDKSFVRDIVTDSDDRALIAAVLLMAHTMELKVVAEGVEGMNQLNSLHELHCDEAQGFFFSRPLPADEFRQLVIAAR